MQMWVLRIMNGSSLRTEKTVPDHGVSFWRGVLRDYLLRRRWVLQFLGNERKRQLLRSLFSDPFPEGHPVDRDSFFSVLFPGAFPKALRIFQQPFSLPESAQTMAGIAFCTLRFENAATCLSPKCHFGIPRINLPKFLELSFACHDYVF